MFKTSATRAAWVRQCLHHVRPALSAPLVLLGAGAPQPWLWAGRGQPAGEAFTAPWTRFISSVSHGALSSIIPLPWLYGDYLPISPARLFNRDTIGLAQCLF